MGRVDKGSIKISYICAGALQYGVAVVIITGGFQGSFNEVKVGVKSISFIIGSISFHRINQGVRSLLKMSNINISSNGVSNEEDFWSCRSRHTVGHF